jgi:hypothetical protein
MATCLKNEAVVELELNHAKCWRGADLLFLQVLAQLRSFKIIDLRIGDISPIHSLHNLRSLHLMTYCKTAIQFSAFPQLERCGLEWRVGATSLFDCRTLKHLFVNSYDRSDVTPFARLSNLESLQILNAQVNSLRGLEPLVHLRSLRIANLKHLRSLAGIEQMAQLEKLELSTCRKISSLEPIGNLKKLRALYLNDNRDIDSLGVLDKLTELESVTFCESTNIRDGNLYPLWRQEHLKRIAFQNRRHYSHRREEFKAFNQDIHESN